MHSIYHPSSSLKLLKCFVSALVLLPIFSAALAADSFPDEARLRGFAEHQREQTLFDKQRDAGRVAHDEEFERWEKLRAKGIEDYRKQSKVEAPKENGPEHKEFLAEKEKFEKQRSLDRIEYSKGVKKFDRSIAKGLVSEEEEYGLYTTRPRFDYKKRCSLGFNHKYCKPGAGAGGSSMGGSSGGGGGSYFPPPPSFDDFGGTDSGYIPPPNLGGEGDAEFPPPPPPPPMFPEGEGGFNDFSNGMSSPPPFDGGSDGGINY